MTQSSGQNQALLSAFDATDTVDERDKKDHETTPEQTTQSQTESCSYPETLEDLYTMLEDAAESMLPQAAFGLPVSQPICPQTKHCTTRNLPGDIPALPFHVGQWELAVHDESRIIYTTSGDAYDTRWGEGGAIFGMEVYLNNCGANRDDKYHRRSQLVVGYENGYQVRTTNVDSKDDLRSPRGHNVGENDGDHAISSGTKTRAESPREAVLELLIHLHQNPGPLGQYVTRDPETAWTLEKLSPRTAKWTAPAPAHIDDETVTLLLADNRLQITSNSDGQSYADRTCYAVPELATVPESLREGGGTTGGFKTVAAAIAATNELLSAGPVAATSNPSKEN